MKNNVIIPFVIVVIVLSGFFVWKNYIYLKQDTEQLPIQSEQIVENNPSASITIPDDWKEYRNEELHFSFSYPIELGDPKASFDSNPQRTGEQFGATLYNSTTSLIFGASSPDYNPNVGRGGGGVDFFRDLSTWQTNDSYTVSSIQSNGIIGKLISGMEECDGICIFPKGIYIAIFPVPANDKDIEVIGFEAVKMSHDDFLKIISTFKHI